MVLSRLLCLFAAFGMVGCASLLQNPIERADNTAREAGFVPQPGGRFVRAWLKAPPGKVEALTVYIEGDGARWRAADIPPEDPTPENPVSLHLAVQDASPAVAYVGRPCQYLDEDTLNQCDPSLWTHGRYSPDALRMPRLAYAIPPSTTITPRPIKSFFLRDMNAETLSSGTP